MKKFKVKAGDRKFIVDADNGVEAVKKVNDALNKKSDIAFDCSKRVTDSDKLYQLAYKLGQLANYFDRANSVDSREELSRDDAQKLHEFYSLGVQTLNQLKLEVDGMKRANVETNPYLWNDTNKIVKLLDDASNRMFWTRDPKLKVLHEKFEPLIREYSKLSAVGSSNKAYGRVRRDSKMTVDSVEELNEKLNDSPKDNEQIANTIMKETASIMDYCKSIIRNKGSEDATGHCADVIEETAGRIARLAQRFDY